MAWFYNQLLRRFFKIGLVVRLQRSHSPAATTVHEFVFLPRNSHISKFSHLAKCENRPFSNGLVGSEKSGMFVSPIPPFSQRPNRQVVTLLVLVLLQSITIAATNIAALHLLSYTRLLTSYAFA